MKVRMSNPTPHPDAREAACHIHQSCRAPVGVNVEVVENPFLLRSRARKIALSRSQCTRRNKSLDVLAVTARA